MRHVVIVSMSALLLSCSNTTTTSNGGCTSNDECDPGSVCAAGECLTLCTNLGDCPAGTLCQSGTCETASGTVLPVIDGVAGNDTTDATRIVDGLVVTGRELAEAAFELRDAGAFAMALSARSQSADTAELVLPEDIRSGDYILVATNAIGSAQAPVTLTLPELTGDVLLDRINTDATGTVSVNRLPVGPGASEVAAGSHGHAADISAHAQSGGHDGRYVLKAGDTMTGALSAPSVDLGPGADDDLTALDAESLTSGPMSDASALHTHAGLNGGVCYTAYGTRTCDTANGFSAASTGYLSSLMTIQGGGWTGGAPIFCMDDAGHSQNWAGGATNYYIHVLRGHPSYFGQAGNGSHNNGAGPTGCVICCK